MRTYASAVLLSWLLGAQANGQPAERGGASTLSTPPPPPPRAGAAANAPPPDVAAASAAPAAAAPDSAPAPPLPAVTQPSNVAPPAATTAPPAPSSTNTPLVQAPASSSAETRTEPASPSRTRAENPLSPIGIGFRLGVAGMGRGALTAQSNGRSLTTGVDPRRGFHLAIPLHFGARMFYWTLEPYFSKSSISHGVRDMNGLLIGREAVDLKAWGIFTGPGVNIHVARPLYVSIGVGVKGAYLANDAFDYALDAYLRAPLALTYYPIDQLGLVVELGLGYGFSLFADLPRIVIDPITNRPRTLPEQPQLGTAFAWDLSFGIRLP
jgi:hypothetical protein